MRQKEKLSVLLRAREASEKEASQHLKHVSDVVDERRGLLQELLTKKNQLLEKLKKVQCTMRRGALRDGDVNMVSSTTSYTKRLESEASQLDGLVRAQQIDLERAVEREKIAAEEVVQARVEKKKIEHLISNKQQLARATGTARDEMALDEMITSRAKK